MAGMRIAVALACLVACGNGGQAKPDAAIDATPDAPIDGSTDPMFLVPCGANWAGVQDAPQPGVMCAAACADHSAIGQTAPCSKAHTAAYDGFKCTAATATAWNNTVGCCLTQPDFAHVSSEPVAFAVCD